MNDIDLANTRMSMSQAMALIGEDVSEFYTGKIWCPFGNLYHSDGGRDKALRIYTDSNTAFCFAGCGFLNPVRLLAKANDISERDAADMILEKTNYVPPDYESRWAALTASRDEVDTDDLGEALKVFCGRLDPLWETVQFDTEVSTALSRCLQLLPKVRTADEARQWLSTTKQYMSNTLGARHEHAEER